MMKQPGNIYYLCPDTNKPRGGVKVIYEHVDILNAAGFSAYVLHGKRGFRCTWFENSTAVSYFKKSIFDEIDFIVIPEFYGKYFLPGHKSTRKSKFFWNIMTSPSKKIIFNQNSYLTFKGHTFVPHDIRNFYSQNGISAAMVVSEDNEDYLNYLFPEIRIFRVRNSIDTGIFKYQPDKKKQICFIPQKNQDEFVQLIGILNQRKILNGWDFVPIANATRKETAEILRESMLFINLVYQEGFGLPSAEAMACGCTVIGYHGMGGREFYRPEFCFPVAAGSILEVARTVEEVLMLYNENPQYLQDRARKACEFIRINYSPDVQKKDVLSFWNGVRR